MLESRSRWKMGGVFRGVGVEMERVKKFMNSLGCGFSLGFRKGGPEGQTGAFNFPLIC